MNFMPQMQNYDDVDRRRMLGSALMQGGMNFGSPLGALASVFGGLASRSADKREKQIMADEKTAAEERRRMLGESLMGLGPNASEADLANVLLQNGEYDRGIEMAINSRKQKAPQGLDATEFLTKYGDKFDGTPEQFVEMSADGIVSPQELAALKRKQDPKDAAELQKLQSEIAKNNALAAKAGRGPAPQQLTPMQQAMAALSTEDMQKAARIQMGLDPRAVAGKPTAGDKTASAQVSANSADTTLSALEEMLSGGKINTGPIAGSIGSVIPTSERQQFDALVAQLAPEIKKLQRTAGEGAFSDADLQLLLRSMPNATTDEAANLEIIKQIRNKVGALGGAIGGSSPEQIAVNPQTGEKLALRNGQWVPL